MENLKWLNNFNGESFITPFKIDKDSEYLPSLKTMFSKLNSEFENSGIDKSILFDVSNYMDTVIKAIDLYYQGNIVSAQLLTNELLSSFDSAPAITKINNSIAFNCNDTEIQFFRARLSENAIDFSAEEMLHIPFNKRSIVKSERFSIPGLPSLYLGNSSYVCWIELGCPAEYKFNVSPFILDNSQKVLNLTVTYGYLLRLLDTASEKTIELSKEYVKNLLKLMVLTLATSYRVNEKERNFKSEYILSQMIMLSCKNLSLDGIIYYSKQVSEEIFAMNLGINLVLFATYNGENNHSSICDHIQVGRSFNFAMFKQLLPCQLYKNYELNSMHTPYIKNIGDINRQIPYQETYFFEFDKYLFANWNK